MILLILSLFLFSLESKAQVPQTFTYQGQILQNGTTPLEGSSVAFLIKILSPGPEGCVLYQEQHFVNMTGSNGVFSLSIGNGMRTGSNSEDISNLQTVFSNTTPFTSLSTCVTGSSYNPAAAATRKIRVTYNDGNTTVTLAQDHHLQATPFAWYANSLQGLTPTNFVQVNPVQNVTQSNLEAVFGGTNYTSLLSLIAGSSNLYMRKDATGAHLPTFGATPPGVTAGSVWYDTTAHQMKFYDGAAVQVVAGDGVGHGTITSITAGSGLSGGEITLSGTIDVATGGITSDHILDGTVADVDLASGIDASKITTGMLPTAVVPSDVTKLSLSGGTMSGTLDMGGQQVLATGHMTMSPTSTITIGNYTAAQQAILTASLTAVNAGAVWYNSDMGSMMYWDGAAAQTLSNLATAGGDITDVVAGSGLSGGATVGSATLGVATGGITSTHILDGTIATDDLADASVTDVKITAMAASKLTGIVPNANLPIGVATAQLFTIDQVPHCATNQKLEMSNGPVYAWTCATDTDSGGDITEVTTTAPLSGGGTGGAIALTLAIDNSTIAVNGSSQLEVKDAGITDAKIVGVSVDKITSAAGKYFSYMPAGTECATGEILKWDATNDRWECGSDSNAVTSVFSRTGIVTAQSGDYTATQITNTAAGNIAATTAQAAIDELDAEKLALAGGALTGAVTTTSSVTFNAQNQARFADSDSSNYVALQSPGTVASNIIFTLPADAGTSGQVLTTDGAGILTWTSGNSGDITGVAAGSGLSGGGTTGDVSLAVATDGITSTHILDGTIATADLDDASVTNDKISAVNVSKVASATGEYFLYKPNDTACTAGQVLKWNSSRWECGTDNDTGDITAVNTTAPLAGGGASGALTLTLNYDDTTIGINGSSQIEVKDDGITTAKILDGAVTDAKVATVSVDKITSAALKYFSYMPAGTECATGEVLKWNAVSDHWECGTDTDTQLITSVFSRTGAVTAQSGDYTATQITNTAAGNIAATTAQAAVDELDSEKVSKAGDAMSGNLTLSAQSQLRLADSDSSNFVALQSPASVSSNVTFTLPGDDGASGQVLITDGSGVLSWSSAAVGDVTGVTAGSGLTGGGTSGDLAIAVDTGGITSTHILDGTIATADLADASVTDAKITAVDVSKIASASGSYFLYQPNNTACTAGQVLKWNNSRWECGTDDNTGDITSVIAGTGLTGGATSGPATLSIDVGTGAAQFATNDAVPHCTSTQKLEMSAGPVYAWTCTTDVDSGGDITAVTTTAPLNGGGSTGALALTIAYDNSTIGINGSSELEVKDDGITSAKIIDGAVTDAKIATVSVDKISSAATKYFSYMPAGTECASGEILKWNATSDRWECGADIDTDTQLITSVFSRTGVVTAQSGDYTAAQITNTAAGSIAATSAQAAINELDTEKLSLAGGTLTGALTTTSSVTLNAQNEVRFADGDSSNYVAFRSPSSVASDVTFTLPGDDGTSGQVLITDGSGVLSWSSAAVGDVTGVTAGSGLTGGGTSGDLSIAVDTGGITSTHILDGTIDTADLADASVTDAKITAVNVSKITNASGNYFLYAPNNTACATGEVLKWNNSRWECGTDDNSGDITAVTTTAPLNGGGSTGALALTLAYDNSTIGINGSSEIEVKDDGITTAKIIDGAVTDAKIVGMGVDKITSASGKYFSYMPSGTECSSGELLKWNATNDRWECGADIDTNTQLITSVFGRTGVVTATAGDYTAAQITNTAAGNIAATTAQAAIDELDAEKLPFTGGTLTGALTTTSSVTLNAQNEVRFADGDSSNYVAFRAPSSVASDVTFTLPADDGTSGQVLITDGSGILSWSSAAVGDVTGMTAGSGLTGGGTSGDFSIAVDTDGITTTHILDGTIDTADLADASVTDAKITALNVSKIASGTGNYFLYQPNNTACSTGQTLKWNNSRWECGDDDNSGDITSVVAGTGLTGGATSGAATLSIDVGSGASQFATNDAVPHCTGAQKLEMSAGPVYAWTCTSDLDSGGDITAVTTTAPLTGGGTSGALALTIAYDDSTIGINGSSQLEVKDDGVTTAKILDGAVTDAKITGLAVDKIASGATKYFSYMPAGTECGDGEILKWDATSDRWECGTDIDTNTQAITSVFSRTGVVTAQAGDYTAAQITTTAAGNIAATTAQAAIDELDAEKLPLAGGTLTGALTTTSSMTFNAQNEVRFADGDSSNYVAFRAPSSVASDVTFTLPVDDGTSGQVLITDGTGVLSWSSAAVGDVTGVTAGSGLTGGGTSGDFSVAVDTDGITTTHILDGTIATVDLANSSVTDAKIAGVNVGKITNASGNYFLYAPNNTACATGEVLKWNNSRWECGVDNNSGDITEVTTTAPLSGGATNGAIALTIGYDNSSIAMNGSDQLEVKDGGITNAKIAGMTVDKITSAASKYFSYMPAGTECGDGELLKWDATNDRWECGTDTDTNTQAITSVFSRTGVVSAQAGDYTATQITNTAAGNIAATTAQAAIDELDAEKLSLTGGTLSGALITASSMTLNAQNEMRFADSDSSNYIALRAPSSVASNVTLTLPIDAGTSGQVLITNGSGALSWSSAAVGDVTGVTAGSGLTGGGASGDLSIAVNTGGITSTHILDGTIATADLADSSVTDTKVVAVSVDKITSGATKYFSYMPAGTECATGEVLKWNASTDRWTCGTDSDTGDITGVTAGTGLTGGGTSGAPTLDVDLGTGGSQLFTNDDVPHCLSTQKLEMGAGPVYTWSCVTDLNAGGDITAVTTTAPLSGGASSGAIALTINYDNSTIAINGSNQLEVKDGGVTTAKINDGAITDAKITAVDVSKIASSAGNYFTYLPNNVACANNQVLKWNTTDSRWQCGTDSDTGDITAVTTTAPLSGGASSGAISLSISYDNSTIGVNGSSQLEVRDDAIATAKISDGAVTDAKITSMDISKIISSAGNYFTYLPNNVACTNNQVLKWNNASSRWQCGADNDSGDITAVTAGSGLTGGSTTGIATLSVDTGNGASQFFTNSAVPSCSSNEKLSMSAGPVYSWSCVADVTARTTVDADGDTFVKVEASADEDTIRINTAGAERLTIDSSGFVGVGTAPGSDRMRVYGDIRLGTTLATGCIKDADGTGIAGTCSSDMRLKKNIKPIAEVSAKLSQLTPKSYQWRSDEFPGREYGNQVQIGVMAQEVGKLFPELVTTDEDGFYRVKYQQLPFYLLQGFSEQYREVSSLKEKVNTLEQENQQLKQRLDAIEKALKIKK